MLEASPAPDEAFAPGAAGVLARLAAKEEARRAERAARAQIVAARAAPREDAGAWLASFATRRADLAAAVDAAAGEAAALSGGGAAGAPPAVAAPGSNQAALLLAELEGLLTRAAELEASIADAAYYLPSYDLKQAAAGLAELRAATEAARAALAPRRRFAFSRRPAGGAAAGALGAGGGGAAAAAAGPAQQQQPQQQAQQQTAAPQQQPLQQPLKQQQTQQQQQPQQQQQQPAAGPPALSAYDAGLVASGHGLSGLSGRDVVLRASALAGREFLLADLMDCRVWLLGEMPALRALRLTRCTVVAGPVRGAAFVDGADGCTLALASHQVGRSRPLGEGAVLLGLAGPRVQPCTAGSPNTTTHPTPRPNPAPPPKVRLHSMTGCDAYLRVRSRPIIEHCCALRFAPLTGGDLAALGLAEAAAAAGLGAGGDAAGSSGGAAASSGAECGVECGELWRAVDDFGWVKATQSPNWAVLPEGERAPVPAPPEGACGVERQEQQEPQQQQERQPQATA
jgi:hypothetical protein